MVQVGLEGLLEAQCVVQVGLVAPQAVWVPLAAPDRCAVDPEALGALEDLALADREALLAVWDHLEVRYLLDLVALCEDREDL